MSNKNKKNLMIILLLVSIIFMSVGYAMLSIEIEQKQNYASSDSVWDIKITAISSIETQGLAENISATIENNFSAKFNSSLQTPNDKVAYMINVKNHGTIDAKLSSINIIPSDNQENNISYSIEGIELDEVLKSGESKLFTLVAHYDNDIPSEEEINKEVTLILDYIQN